MYQGIKCVPSHIHIVTAVGVTWALTEALVHLNPTSLDRVCRAQSTAEVMRPDVGGEPVMAVIRHANRVRRAPAARKSDDNAEKFSSPASPARSLPVHQMGGFGSPISDLKSTCTCCHNSTLSTEVCCDDRMIQSHIPVEGGHHG